MDRRSFAHRLAQIPPELLRIAKGGLYPGATLEEILDHAEYIMAAKLGAVRGHDDDVVHHWPGLTRRQTRVICSKLHDQPITDADDLLCICELREWFLEM